MENTLTTKENHAFSAARTGQTATAISLAAIVAVITLTLLYSGFPFFGPVNDLTNAVAGVLYFTLALQIHPLQRTRSAANANLLLAAAAAAMLLTSINSVMVAFGQLDWQTGGIYTALGLGFLGIWLLGTLRSGILQQHLTERVSKLGLFTGFAMLVGFAAGPLFTGWTVSNALVYVSYIGAAAGWLLFPVWTFFLGKRLRMDH